VSLGIPCPCGVRGERSSLSRAPRTFAHIKFFHEPSSLTQADAEADGIALRNLTRAYS